MNLGVDGRLLFEEVATEVGWLSGRVGTFYGRRNEDNLRERWVDATNTLFLLPHFLFLTCVYRL